MINTIRRTSGAVLKGFPVFLYIALGFPVVVVGTLIVKAYDFLNGVWWDHFK